MAMLVWHATSDYKLLPDPIANGDWTGEQMAGQVMVGLIESFNHGSSFILIGNAICWLGSF